MRARNNLRYRSSLVALLLLPGAARAAEQKLHTIPVVLDTDIGSDIDDAFALAMVLRAPALRLVAVTTVSGNTEARARIAAKMLALAGRSEVPVAAGAAQAGSPIVGAPWAADYHGPALTGQPAVELLHDKVEQGNGKTVLIAIGALTNIAALLRQYPQEAKKIREIVLMGGSFHHGYTLGSGQIAESNIASDAPAAQVVFTSGIPLRMAPLDVTARLQLEPAALNAIFARHTSLTEALRAQYRLWAQPVPTLHDPMAIALLLRPELCRTVRSHVTISAEGWTRLGVGQRSAVVALHTRPERFLAYFQQLLTDEPTGRGRGATEQK